MGKPIPYTVRRKIFAVLTGSGKLTVSSALSIPGNRNLHRTHGERCKRGFAGTFDTGLTQSPYP